MLYSEGLWRKRSPFLMGKRGEKTLTVNGRAGEFTLSDGTTWTADYSTKDLEPSKVIPRAQADNLAERKPPFQKRRGGFEFSEGAGNSLPFLCIWQEVRCFCRISTGIGDFLLKEKLVSVDKLFRN